MILTKHTLDQETLDNIRQEGIPVIIFGAGIVGEALFHACCNSGIKVECFCDNNINKTKFSKCGLEVVHPSSLGVQHKKAIFLISAADITDVIKQLRLLGCSKWYAGSLLLSDFDVAKYQFNAPMDFVRYAIDTCILCHDNCLTPDKLFLRSVDIIITERCSLKCRDCSNLMQYYEKPEDCNTVELFQAIDAFCAVADEVNEFRVIGGEPFMNQEFHLIIKKLINEPKVKKIVIYTNGTIAPREDKIECLKNSKVLLIITDYGKLSKNLNNLIQLLEKNNIAFYAEKARGWTNCSKIIKHNRNVEQQKIIFRNCCAKNTFTLSNGKFYRCPFAANADRLRAIPDLKNDYIDLFQKSVETMNIYEIKKKIKAFILEREFFAVCDYCNGRSFGDPEIQSAIQMDKSLPYCKYNE